MRLPGNRPVFRARFGGYVTRPSRRPTAGPPFRGLVLGLSLFGLGAADLPPLPLLDIDLGAGQALARNDRDKPDRDRGDRDRGDRGRGHDRRDDRAERHPWRGDGAGGEHDNGRHLGHDGDARRGAQEIAVIPPRKPGVGLAGDIDQDLTSHGRDRALDQGWVRLPDELDLDDPGALTFRNHGDEVRTMVAIAKSLGFSGSVGAMQANFGTPLESGLVEWDPVLEEYFVTADEATIAAVKPGNGPKSGWEIMTALDVNKDGRVNLADLWAAFDVFPDDDTGDTGL